MATVTAKVTLNSKVETGEGDDRQARLIFNADYADGRNKEWAKYTPALNLDMTVNAPVGDLFEAQGKYTLTFEKTVEDDE